MKPRAFARGDHVELATALLEAIGDPLVGDLGSIHTYDPELGIWRAVDGARQSQIVQGFASLPCGDRGKSLQIRIGDVNGTIRLALDRVVKPGFFDAAPIGVAFQNGFVRVADDGLRFEPHAPENRCRYAYPFDIAEAPAEAWQGFLRGLFRDDVDRDEKIACLGEFFGASLLGLAPRYQKCVVTVGSGDEGKSTLAEIVTKAFPSGALTAIAPQAMGQEYRRAELAGKRLNVVNELPESTILESESFKAIIVGNLIEARHIREPVFHFKPSAGHYFAANRLPGTKDQTRGFWRRFIVITFNRSFENDPERDPMIGDKIVRDHLPAVVWWLLEGAARLLKQGRYTLPSSHDAALAEWRLESDQVAEFLAACGTLDPTAATGASHFYAVYRQWAALAGHRNLLSIKAFGSRLRLLRLEPNRTGKGFTYPLRLTTPDV